MFRVKIRFFSWAERDLVVGIIVLSEIEQDGDALEHVEAAPVMILYGRDSAEMQLTWNKAYAD